MVYKESKENPLPEDLTWEPYKDTLPGTFSRPRHIATNLFGQDGAGPLRSQFGLSLCQGTNLFSLEWTLLASGAYVKRRLRVRANVRNSESRRREGVENRGSALNLAKAFLSPLYTKSKNDPLPLASKAKAPQLMFGTSRGFTARLSCAPEGRQPK